MRWPSCSSWWRSSFARRACSGANPNEPTAAADVFVWVGCGSVAAGADPRDPAGLGEILLASRRADSAVVVHLYQLGADGPLRPDLARTRRVHGHRCLRHGAAVEL